MIRPLLSLLLLGALGAAAPAHADCSRTVRLDEAGGSVANLPVFDQDGVDACYSYVATLMADAYRHREARRLLAAGEWSRAQASFQLNFVSSPLRTAVADAVATNKSVFGKGFIDDSLKAIWAKDGCSYQFLGDRFGAHDVNGFMKDLKTYFDRVKRAPAAALPRPPSPLDCCLNADSAAPLSRNNLANYLQANTFMEFVEETFAAACHDQRRSLPPLPLASILREVESYKEPNPTLRARKYRSLLDAITNKTSLPVGITYCSDLLYQRGAVGVNAAGRQESCARSHSSLIVGRRPSPDGAGCQVLIRNSFGTSCNGYDDAWECDERGQLWVDESALLDNAMIGVSLE